jgi:hypothetical protein
VGDPFGAFCGSSLGDACRVRDGLGDGGSLGIAGTSVGDAHTDDEADVRVDVDPTMGYEDSPRLSAAMGEVMGELGMVSSPLSRHLLPPNLSDLLTHQLDFGAMDGGIPDSTDDPNMDFDAVAGGAPAVAYAQAGANAPVTGIAAAAVSGEERRRRARTGELPPGWSTVDHQAPAGPYKVYHGPQGEKVRSKVKAWDAYCKSHNAAQQEPAIPIPFVHSELAAGSLDVD